MVLDETCCRLPGRYCDLTYDADRDEIVCNSSAVIAIDDIYNIEQLCKSTDIFDSFLYFLSADGFEDKNIPISKLAKTTDIPLFTFSTNFYVSSECSLSPIRIANKLLRAKKKI